MSYKLTAKYTCPIIDNNINDIKSDIESVVENIFESIASPVLYSKQKSLYYELIKEYSKNIYEIIFEEYIENIRSSNSNLRDECIDIISEANDEIKFLTSKIDDLESRIE